MGQNRQTGGARWDNGCGKHHHHQRCGPLFARKTVNATAKCTRSCALASMLLIPAAALCFQAAFW
eukprot:11199088-Lingulodinium_polyedra.AAC.1